MYPNLELSKDLLSMDVVAFSYLWLKEGGSIVVQPGLSHFHRKRLDSVSILEKETSKISKDYSTKKLQRLI